MTLETGTMASAPEYDLHAPVIEFNAFSSVEDDQDDSYACCTISLKLTRRYNAFCIRIVVPCAMISAISLSIFFLEPVDLNDRLNMLVTLTLAMTAFLYVASDAIPAVPYTTIADKYIMITFFVLLLEILYICIANATNIESVPDSIAGFCFVFTWSLIQSVLTGIGIYNVYKSKRIIKMCFSELSDAGLLPEESNTVDVTVGEAKILYPF